MTTKVLIVEDEIISAMALAETIPAWGCRVVDMVVSGEDAIRAAEAHRPDVVLMDVTLHGSIGGIGAAREIIGRLGIPVIFMTGHDDAKTTKALRNLKPLAMLVKPLDSAALKELLEGI